jgi:type II secretory pathway component PulF
VNEPQPNSGIPPEPVPESVKPLSEREAAELAGRVAALSKAGLPLAPGLRAAAAELPDSRLAAALNRIAAALDGGQSLDQTMAAERRGLPHYLQALVAAGIHTGKLGQTLEEFVEFRQTSSDIRRSVWLAIAYPAVVLALLLGVIVFLSVTVVPAFAKIFRDFKSDLPSLTRAIIAFSRVILPILGYALLLCAAVAVLMLIVGRRRRRWILNRLPLFGVLWRYSGLAEMACLLRILVASDVPLPESLRLTADGIGDADLASGCRQAAARVESGSALADAVRDLPQFDPTTRPMIAWGESRAALAEAVDTVSQAAIGRVQLRADLLRAVLPPGVFLCVAAVMLCIMALFMPLVALITNLTGGSRGAGGITSYPPTPPPTPFAVPLEILLIVAPLVICGWLVSIVARMQRTDERPMFARFVPWLTAALCFFGVLVLVTSVSTRNPDVALIGAIASLSLLALISAWVIYLDRTPYVAPLDSLRAIAEGVFYGLGMIVVTVLFFALNPFVAICWLALVFYLGAFAFRYRQSQRRALLDLMSRAADRGMPLAPAVRAFGESQGCWFRGRAWALAESLEAGHPTPEAIARNRGALPPQSELAARLGETTGALGATLRAADTRRNGPVRNGSLFPVRWVSIIVVLAAGGCIVPFMTLKLLPAWQKIYQDFHSKLPPPTAALVRLLSWPYAVPVCIVVSAAMLSIAAFVALRQMGWLRDDAAPFRRLLAPFDAAVVLRWLALVAERGLSLEPTLGMLAVRYPHALIRKRLRRAGTDIFCGRDWALSLWNVRMLDRSDTAIVRAAARVGNLPWALREAASNVERRLNYRLAVLGQAFFPFLILAIGAAVMLFVVAWFLPLIDLIHSLAGPGGRGR